MQHAVPFVQLRAPERHTCYQLRVLALLQFTTNIMSYVVYFEGKLLYLQLNCLYEPGKLPVVGAGIGLYSSSN
uniref:Uncharacterized protein n=1 Tax=Wuchereria bancrofti TaxID=6293 RepID=A0AAF5PZR2_WUCBA